MQVFKKIWNAITTLLVVAVMALAVLLAGVRLIGLQAFTVLSGSMEPAYHVGALIYVRQIEDTTKIADGTVITFMLSEDVVATHRVVAAVPDEDDPAVVRYRTKGDANETEDGALVHCANIIGTPVFSIPWLGYLAEFIRKPPGSYIALSAGAILMILVFLPDLLFEDKEEQPAGEKPKKPARARKFAPRRGKYQRP